MKRNESFCAEKSAIEVKLLNFESFIPFSERKKILTIVSVCRGVARCGHKECQAPLIFL